MAHKITRNGLDGATRGRFETLRYNLGSMMNCRRQPGSSLQRGAAKRASVALLLCVVSALGTACAPSATPQNFVTYNDPDGRFSILVPADWRIDASSSQYELFAGKPAEGNAARFAATLGITWGPPPCDRLMVQDPVAWYADITAWGPDVVEHSRVETEVDGRRALLVDFSSVVGGEESRHLALVMESYGIVWIAVCSAAYGADFSSFEKTFRKMVHSLVIYGAWSGLATS